jgi:hypothetical protein
MLRVVRWILGLAVVIASLEVVAQMVFLLHPHFLRFADYPWNNVGAVAYTHLCSLLICATVTLVALALHITMKHFRTGHDKPFHVERSPGMVTKHLRPHSEQLTVNRVYALDIGALCLLIVTLTVLDVVALVLL